MSLPSCVHVHTSHQRFSLKQGIIFEYFPERFSVYLIVRGIEESPSGNEMGKYAFTWYWSCGLQREVQERRLETRVEESVGPQVWNPEGEGRLLFLGPSPGLPVAALITEQVLTASEEQWKVYECYFFCHKSEKFYWILIWVYSGLSRHGMQCVWGEGSSNLHFPPQWWCNVYWEPVGPEVWIWFEAFGCNFQALPDEAAVTPGRWMTT